MAYAPPTVGPAGLTIPSYQDIFNDNIAQFLKIYGSNQYVGVDSAIYQLLAIFSLKMSDVLKALQFVYNQSSPNTAVGAGLDRIIKLNGMARKPFSFSLVILTLTGTVGAVIPAGSAALDTNGNLWVIGGGVVIPGGGSINVNAQATLPGSITANAGQINTIATPVAGWTGVTNNAASTPGTPIETDSQVRARQAISVALPSKTMYTGTVAAIAALPTVTRYFVEENPTGGVDANGCPAHSITAVVEGGVQSAIAQAIYLNHGIGALMNGAVQGQTPNTVTVQVADPITGFVIPVSFINPPTYVPIFVIANVHLLPGGTSATLTAISAAIVNYLQSLQIGEVVTFSAIMAAAMAVTPNLSVPIFSIRSLFIGTSSNPTLTNDITMLFFQVAQGLAGNITVNSV